MQINALVIREGGAMNVDAIAAKDTKGLLMRLHTSKVSHRSKYGSLRIISPILIAQRHATINAPQGSRFVDWGTVSVGITTANETA